MAKLSFTLAHHLLVVLLFCSNVKVASETSLRGGAAADPEDLAGEGRKMSHSIELDHDFIKRLRFAAKLSKDVKDPDLMDKIEVYNGQYQSFMAWFDGINDRTLVAKEDGVCYINFESQNRHRIFDVWQTINPFVKRKVFGTNCNVRWSFYSQYETPFADKLRLEVDRCVESCNAEKGTNCELVISGASTGGSTAIIASLDPRLKQYDPTVLALGPLRAIVNDDCETINLEKTYRFVTANSGMYDAISDISPKIGRHFGKFFMLDEMNGINYISPNDNTVRSPDSYAFHHPDVYLFRLMALANRNPSDFPLTVTNFEAGHWCTMNDECQSGSCELSGYCGSQSADTPLFQPGASCTIDTECTSGVCINNMCTLPSGLLGTGAPCAHKTQCNSGRCVDDGAGLVMCLDKWEVGSPCKENSDCISNNCAGHASWISGGMQMCFDESAVPQVTHHQEERKAWYSFLWWG